MANNNNINILQLIKEILIIGLVVNDIIGHKWQINNVVKWYFHICYRWKLLEVTFKLENKISNGLALYISRQELCDSIHL